MKNFLTGILFCVLALGGFAQDEYVDSLRNELAVADSDSAKIVIYGELFDYYYQYDNINIADNNADSILLYSLKCKSKYFFASAYSSKAVVKYAMGDYAASAKYYGCAEHNAKNIQDTSLLCLIYTGLGDVYYQYRDKKKAHYYYNKAIEEIKKIGDENSYSAALLNLANIYFEEKKYDTTLVILDSALNLSTENNIKIYIYDYIAKTHSITGKLEEAKNIYANIIKMFDDNTDIYTYVSALNNISGFYIQENRFQQALNNLNIIDSICRVNRFDEIRLKLYQNYHDFYLKTGNYGKSSYYIERYNSLRDSIFSINLARVLNDLENRNLREKSLLELRLRDEEISHQKTLNAILFSIIAIVLTFIAVIAFLLVKKNRLNKALNKLNADLKQRDAEISSNLDYAREIQLGCMSNSLTESNLQMFVLDRPKSVVGGDFYISQTKGDASYVVVGDCTGHGISGGFLSVLGIKSVYAALEKYDNLPEMASFINNEFCKIVSSAENLKGESLCLSMLRICGNEVRFLGSKQKMWLVSDGEVREYKSSNAIMGSADDEVFMEEIINVKSSDVVFLSSDGYPDQFGADGKLKYPRFRKLLLESSHKNPDEAKAFLFQKLNEWRGNNEQTDDVMVVGIYF